MIKELEAHDIVKVLQLKDTIPCKRDQWMQFLMSLLNNEKVIMLGDIDNGINSYAIIVDNRFPPISDKAGVIHFWANDYKKARYLFNACVEELKKRNITKATMSVPLDHNEKYVESFGGKIVAYLCELDLGEVQYAE